MMKLKTSITPKPQAKTKTRTRIIQYSAGTVGVALLIAFGFWLYFQIGQQEDSRAATGGTPPANDTKAQAEWLTDLYEDESSDAEFTNSHATGDAVSGSCFANGTQNGVWFKFQALYTDATITLKTGGNQGSIQNAEIALFDANDNEITCAAGSGTSNVSINPTSLTQDDWYYVLVDSETPSDTGSFTMYINNVSPVKYYTRTKGPWDETNTWSTNGYNGPPAGSLPSKEHVVFVEDIDGEIKLDGIVAECAGIFLTENNKKVEMKLKGNSTLNVFGQVSYEGSGQKEMVLDADDATFYIQDGFYLNRTAGNGQDKFVVKKADFTVERSLIIEYQTGDGTEIELQDNNTFSVGEDFIIERQGGNSGMEVKVQKTDIVVGNDFKIYQNGGNGGMDVKFEESDITAGGMGHIEFGNGNGGMKFEYKKNADFTVGKSLGIYRSGGLGVFEVLIEDNVSMDVSEDFDFHYNSGNSNVEFTLKKNCNITTGGDFSIQKNGGNNGFDILVEDQINITAGGNGNFLMSGGSGLMQLDVVKNVNMNFNGTLTMEKSQGGNNAAFNFEDDVSITTGDDVAIKYSNGSAGIDVVFLKNAHLISGGKIMMEKTGGQNAMQIDLEDNAYLEAAGDIIADHTGGSNGVRLRVGRNNSTAYVKAGGDFGFGSNDHDATAIDVFSDSYIEVKGDVYTAGPHGKLMFNDNASMLKLTGSTIQNVKGEADANGLEIDYLNVLVDNSYPDSVPSVILDGPVLLEEQIELADGILQSTQTNLLTLGQNINVVGSSGSSFVDGPVNKLGHSDFLFPVGNDGVFAPIELANYNNGNSSTEMQAQYFFEGHPDKTTGTSLDHISKIEYWDVEKVNGNSNLQAEVVLHWKDGDRSVISELPDLTIAQYDGSEWYSLDPTTVSGSVGTGQIGTDNGQNTFGPFSFGSLGGANILPIELTTFDASAQDNGTVLLSWETEMEVNNDYFTLERSADGEYFEEIGTVRGAGNSDERLQYSFVDEQPATGTNYYRLKQTDFDGKFEYFPVKEVELRDAPQGGELEITEVYPVPFTDQFTLRIDCERATDANLALVNMSGAQFPLSPVSLSSGSNTIQSGDVSHLPKGTYILTITTSEKTYTRKIVKAR